MMVVVSSGASVLVVVAEVVVAVKTFIGSQISTGNNH